MCNLYRLHKPTAAIVSLVRALGIELDFPEGLPNFEPRDIRITERAPILRAAGSGLKKGHAELVQRRWSWKGIHGKPVFNLRGEGRGFAPAQRCIALADGFYEFTAPADPPSGPKPKRKDRWLFTPRPERNSGHDWFGIASVLHSDPDPQDEAFALLTCEPGPDVALLHHRQIVLLSPADCVRWLDPAADVADLIRPSPAGMLACRPAPA